MDLLSVEVHRRFLAPFVGELHQSLLGNGQHPAGAASAVVYQIGPRPDLIGDWHEYEMRHQPYHVARGEVLAGLFVVLLVEAPDELLEDRAHPVVVETFQAHGAVPVQDGPGAEIDRAVQELLKQRSEHVGFDQSGYLVVKPELLQDLLNVGRETVEVCLEVGPQLLLPTTGGQVAETERGRVVEGFAGRLAQGGVLICYVDPV